MAAPKIESQCAQILRYMQSHPKTGISPIEAMYLMQCMRLSARIWDLRHRGFAIRSEVVEGKGYCRYFLEEEAEQ